MRSSSPTIRVRLVTLVMALVLPVIAISGLGAVLLWHSGLQATERDLRSRAASLAGDVGRELATDQATLQALATSPSLEAGDLPAFARQIANSPRLRGHAVVLSDRSGQMLLNSSAPPGTHLPRRADMEASDRVFATGQVQLAPIHAGALSGTSMVGIHVPVVQGGDVAYDLSASFSPAALRLLLERQHLPSEQWIASLLDERLTFLARTKEMDAVVGRTATPDAVAAMRAADSGVFTSRGVQGEPILAGFSRVRGAGWMAVVAVPRATVSAALWRLLGIVAALGAVVLALGLAAALHQSRRIAGSIIDLAGMPGPRRGGIREADTVARILAEAAAERENAQREQRDLLATLDLAAVMVRGLDGVIRFWTAGCERLYGWSAQEAVGQPAHALLHTVLPQPAAEFEANLLRQGEWSGDLRQRRRDGAQIIVAVRKVVRRDAAGRPLAIMEDIAEVTALRRTEAALAESEARLRRVNEDLEARVRKEVAEREAVQARLRHAERMQALGQLAGGIAHDFNNVLQAVQGGASLLERRSADPDGVRRLARMIFEAAERGAGVTRRLLAFSRRGHLRAEPVEPAALLGSIQEVFAHTLGPGVALALRIGPDLPPLLADRGQLETVLINLGTNARDAMEGSGTLTLGATREVVAENGPSPAPGLAPGIYVRLSVADTGAGMEAATLARATEPFFTTKETGKGTGLGLAMARGFAEQSGGALDIESAPGQGTTVRLWLPAGGAAPSISPPVPVARHPGLGRKQLLLVDDEDYVRQVLAEQMEAAGFAVRIAASGPDGLALLDRGEDVDLLISDLSMPGMDGLALIREAQRRRPGLPAILLTGFATGAAEIAVSGALSGTFSLLRKPVEGRALADRIAVMLEALALRE